MPTDTTQIVARNSSTRRLKIAFVFPPIWPPHSDGSLQIWNREVTRQLSRSNDVLVYSGKFDCNPADLVPGVEYRRISTRLDQLFLRVLQRICRALGIQRLLFSIDLWHVLYALKIGLDLRKRRCDVVHIYNYPQFAHFIRRLNPNLRIILNMHGEWLTQIPFTKLQRRLHDPDLIVSCSGLITRAISAKFPDIADHCKTIPMGVSVDLFSKTGRDPRPGAPAPRKLLYVGRISPEKGVHDLIDAFELIHREFSDASLTIVGPEWVAPRQFIADHCLGSDEVAKLAPFYEGSYLSQLKERLSAEVSSGVTFAGLVDHKSIAKYYAAADVYVSPSLYESFGMSIIEAMAAGVPVVAARGGAVPDVVSNERTGLLVATGNPSALAAAVSRLFTNTPLRNAIVNESLHYVRRQFSWETIGSGLLQLYSDAPVPMAARVDQVESVSETKL